MKKTYRRIILYIFKLFFLEKLIYIKKSLCIQYDVLYIKHYVVLFMTWGNYNNHSTARIIFVELRCGVKMITKEIKMTITWRKSSASINKFKVTF